MIPRSPGSRRFSSIKDQSTSERSLHTFPLEHHLNLDIVRRREGLFRFPARLTTSPSIRFPGNDGSQRLTKLLLNVNIESTLGPVHVVISSDNTVNDLIKAAIAIYVKEKRKPLLQETDPKYFQLHYSQFSLESLKAGEKLINLGPRNFFLCLKPSSSVTSCGSEEGKMACDRLFSLTKFMELLL
ncbi:uncharacterized protein LOC111315441 [Durio zibethinus]|uniref:Uncharacterized protein LOC111315441 n=1 Tax=Durio zibethinus TaxID=66656 RepID=A0A6P6B6U8_DURZI|nr:uncharacterized protein LOC111315441 [Durio zibethinus]